VNKEGAEVLYSAISEFAGLTDDSSTVLDVCCGTGTIGMLLASVSRFLQIYKLLHGAFFIVIHIIMIFYYSI